MPQPPTLPWLEAGQAFPATATAWGPNDPAPGLLAAGGALDVATLKTAYARGIFPWFSPGQPPLWWSPNPRMVLPCEHFRLHPSLRKRLRSLLRQGRLTVRMDSDFSAVITACAQAPRPGQDGTWIVPDMVAAYERLHAAGNAHSVETWWDGELAGGLYCVNLGGMVFGESMFSRRSDASKIALAALVAFCRAHHITLIDCQQNTTHLASLGAHEISRNAFEQHLERAIKAPAPHWRFDSVYWPHVLDAPT